MPAYLCLCHNAGRRLELAPRDIGSGRSSTLPSPTPSTHSTSRSIRPDNVFPVTLLHADRRYRHRQSVCALHSVIDVDCLNVQANADSAHLTLTLGTALPDGTPVAVQSLTLLDYAAGQGANVNVVGNDLGDAIVGNHGDNVITGGAGADTITGGGGTDTITGNGGDDTIIFNVADGGREIVDGGSNTDTQVVNNVGGGAETFNINPIDAAHLGIHIEPGSNVAVPATTGNAEISDTNVEEIVVHLGNAGDTVLVSGNLNGTGVLTTTITVDGGSGNDTVDCSAIARPTGRHRIRWRRRQ